VLDRVRRIDPIGLDPFSNAQSIVGAKREFRLDRGEDALRLDWRGYGLVYANPPFGDEIAACMRRVVYFAELASRSSPSSPIALTPSGIAKPCASCAPSASGTAA
jgi:hypothetical protein